MKVMTRNEKKYAARYLEAWNRYGNNLPNEEYDKLSQLRQQLGIRLERAQEINREIVAEAKGGSTVPIRKTGLTNLSERRGSLTDSVGKSPLAVSPLGDNGGAYTQILDEVSQYEATIDEILNEVSDVSEKMIDRTQSAIMTATAANVEIVFFMILLRIFFI